MVANCMLFVIALCLLPLQSELAAVLALGVLCMIIFGVFASIVDKPVPVECPIDVVEHAQQATHDGRGRNIDAILTNNLILDEAALILESLGQKKGEIKRMLKSVSSTQFTDVQSLIAAVYHK
jgi:hypothetical protein